MAFNDYSFVTHWRVQGSIEEVADILSNTADLARWWPAVYLEVAEVLPGDEVGVGKTVSLYTTGWLPYTMRWQFRVTEVDYPHSFALEAWGDFNGRGVWSLEQDDDSVNITYHWQIRADKPMLRIWSFVLKPLFAANHRWAMAKGQESLKLELARRQAQTDEERAKIPPPPAPTQFPSPLAYLTTLAVFAGGGLATVYFLSNTRKRANEKKKPDA